MYNVEKFLQYNSYSIKKHCLNEDIANTVIKELKEIKVAREGQFLTEANKIFNNYKVTKNFKLLVDSCQIADVDLYEKWLYK